MNKKVIKVKPVEGAKVRKPDGTILSHEGEVVDPTPYWIRRIKYRDVEEVIVKENVLTDLPDETEKLHRKKSEKSF